MPPLGNENAVDTVMKTRYMAMMESLHTDTFTQWERAKTYGSQLWPDIQFDGYQVNRNPAENSPYHGYWNPHAHELVEFFRSGDPKWAHDLALPLCWLTTYTAYLNIGQETHDYARSGLCINSSGSGNGQWHRSGFGSDDYMYNLALKHAYVLRPDPIHRRRIEIAGRTVRGRYNRSVREEDRDQYLERLDVARGVIQHMEAGMNCAEFGRDGANQCNTWFLAVMSEFISDNLSTGSICQEDIVLGRRCPQAQTFMQVSMLYEFFVRVYLHYGDLDGGLLRAVTGIPEGLYTYGIDKNGSDINYLGRHAYYLDCTTNNARTSLSSCVRRDVGDGLDLYWHNINSLLSTLLVAEFFDPNLDFCSKVEAAWSSGSQISDSWSGVFVQDAGWIKGTSQMMSFMAYGVGMLDLCNGNTPPTDPPAPAPTDPPITLPPTSSPTPSPTDPPTDQVPPTPLPTDMPTPSPTDPPTDQTPPTPSPTDMPTPSPTDPPTDQTPPTPSPTEPPAPPPAGQSCIPAPTGRSYDVDWGAASAGPYTPLTCLTITNDRPYDREEVAYSSIPLSQSLALFEGDLDRMVVVGADNKRVPAQMVSCTFCQWQVFTGNVTSEQEINTFVY